jgi:hypothetical protein
MIARANVEAAFNRREKITLIKLYREHTGKGLKESKDAIESVIPPCYGNNTDEDWTWTEKQLQCMIELFFGGPSSPNTDDIHEAFVCLRTHWKTLGFSSFKQAAQVILNNF